MMRKLIKKVKREKLINDKIKFIDKFIRGKTHYETLDLDISSLENEIKAKLKNKYNKNKISYDRYTSLMNGLYYYMNVHKQEVYLITDAIYKHDLENVYSNYKSKYKRDPENAYSRYLRRK